MNGKLQQAIEAARSGDAQKAQVLLAQILKDDTKNVHAWFLLSHLVESKEKKVAFLKKVLDLDPAHQKAKERLAELAPEKAAPIVADQAPAAAEPPVAEEAVPVVEETAVSPEPEEQPTPVIFAESASDNLFLQDEDEYLFAEEDDDDLPAWLSEDGGDLISPEALAAEALPEFSDAVDAEDLPDWLTKTNIDDWTVEKPWDQAEDLFDDLDFEEDDEIEKEEEKIAAPVTVKSVIDVARELQEPDPPPPAPKKSPKVNNDSWLNRVLLFLIIVAAVVLILLLYIVITSLG